jgi:serine/threonine protein kinase
MPEKAEFLAEVWARWSEARQRGQRLSPEDLCSIHPELLAEVRGQLRKLEAMAWLEESAEENDPLPVWSGVAGANLEPSPWEVAGTPDDNFRGVLLPSFQKDLLETGLVPAAELNRLLGQPGAAPPANLPELASELIRRGLLTPYQVQMVACGKGKQLFLGNYLLLAKIGAGGMGQVFKAQHRRMKRIVALKLLPEKLVHSPQAVERFRREVEAAGKLEHPNIVTAHDADEAEGRHFLAMQYVEGSDLAKVVHEHGPLALGQAVQIVRQAAAGLHYAHQRGIIHRDIKPSNLLLDAHGQVKILDLGLARILATSGEASPPGPTDLTQDGMVMGTVDYMAPEQAEDTHRADQRADVYSLGCTLYYLLTGQTMYQGATLMARMLAHRDLPIPSLRTRRPQTPAELDAVFQRMVAKKPEERLESMAAVLAALQPLTNLDAPASAPAITTMDYLFQPRSKPPLEIGSSKDVNKTWESVPAREKPVAPPVTKESVSRRKGVAIAALVALLILTPAIYFLVPLVFQRSSNPEMESKHSAGDTDPERAVAVWARTLGGKMLVAQENDGKLQGQTILPEEPLPEGKLELVVLDFTQAEKLTDADLAKIRDLPNLQYLNLSNRPITDAGLKQLANLPNLREIYLDRTKVGDPGCRSLAQFPKLVAVRLEGAAVTAQGAAGLREALPHVNVTGAPP